MMIYNGLYIDKQQRIGRRNGQHSGGQGFVQTSGTTGMARNIGQFFTRFQIVGDPLPSSPIIQFIVYNNDDVIILYYNYIQ